LAANLAVRFSWLHYFNVFNTSVNFLASLATVLTFGTAAYLAFQTSYGRSPLLEWTLTRSRKASIGNALSEIGAPRKIWRKACTVSSQIAARSGEKPTIQSELAWLSGIARDADRKWQAPVVLYGVTNKKDVADQLHQLAYAYAKYGRRLRSQGFLSENALLREQEILASQVSIYLETQANFAASIPSRPATICLGWSGGKSVIEDLYARPTSAPEDRIDHVSVVHIFERAIVEGLASEKWILRDKVIPIPVPVDPNEVELIKRHLNGRRFDGVLPALRAFYRQVDPSSGHRRLVLELSEINYSAVVALNYTGKTGVDRTRDALSAGAKEGDRLFTLAMLPITSDGYLIAVKRSAHVNVGTNLLGPGVGGNLILRDRLGVNVDQDNFGLPDPLLALCREAKEELGLDVSRDAVEILGLGRFSYDEEVGTWVLLASCSLTLKVSEIPAAAHSADQAEGYWELEGEIVAIPLPKDTDQVIHLLRWALNTPELTPHLIGCLLGICIPLIGDHFDSSTRAVQTDELLLSLANHPNAPEPHELKRMRRDHKWA
jgi:8-oxo-dGTP pyrophosphatase MutT (NUDIX family)